MSSIYQDWKIMKKEKETTSDLQIISHLLDKGIVKVSVRYSGGGDSGDMEEIRFHTKDEKDDDGSTKLELNIDDDVYKQLEGKFDSLTNDVEDWWNNEGGYGTVEIQIPSGEYEIINNCYRQEVDTYTHDGVLWSKQEED